MKPKRKPGEAPELVVLDREEPCPYLAERVARLPFRLPLQPLSREQTDRSLASGDRRHGALLYRPDCPGCKACEPIRIDPWRFRPRRSQRRTLLRCRNELTTEIGKPLYTPERLALHEKHRKLRGLVEAGRPFSQEDYVGFFVEGCVETFELRFLLDGRLVGVALTDRGETALSAVYCFYDPALDRLGIGTYAILRQLELCREWKLRHLYLGLYVADNRHMRYKGWFLPHERRIDGRWRRFDTDRDRPVD